MKNNKIFNNKIPNKDIRKAEKQKKNFINKFGDDSNVEYNFSTIKNETLNEFLNVDDLVLSEQNNFEEIQKPVIVGNIRMGYGHYRISMAIASYANALGYKPLWLDLNSLQQATTGKIINHLNNLYSLGSRLSQKFTIFNKLYWEPLNSEGFRKISYNAKDQKMTELMAVVHKNIPKNIPYIATHVWPAQAAIHAGFEKVINIVPDNWPMALHLAEGAIHSIQGFSAYLGYRTMNGFDKKTLKPIPKEQIKLTGHFIDYELVANLESDTEKRMSRIKDKKPLRILISVGGAGAQQNLVVTLLKQLYSMKKENKVAIFINVGDHQNFLDVIKNQLPEIQQEAEFYNNEWSKTKEFSANAIDENIEGIHIFYSDNIFEAVYATNLLMRSTDILITKPSELAYYPVPKLMIQRVGGHEAWGAIRSAEIGDGTIECETAEKALNMLNIMIDDDDILTLMNKNILRNKELEIYDGAKKAIKLIDN